MEKVEYGLGIRWYYGITVNFLKCDNYTVILEEEYPFP